MRIPHELSSASRFLALLAVAVASLLALSAADEPAKAKFEIRRAETEAGEGLVPATVPGRDTKIYLHPVAELTAADITEAKITSNDPPAGTVIAFTFTKEGAKKMETLSAKHEGKPIAFLLDGKVLSAPVVKSKISGMAQITGSYTKEEAERLVGAIRSK